MKLTLDIIRSLINEEVSGLVLEDTTQELEDSAVDTIAGIFIRLDAEGIGTEEVITKAKQEFERNKSATTAENISYRNLKDKLTEMCGDMQSIDMEVEPSHHKEDHEGSMAKRQMFKTAQYAADIFDMIEDGQEFPAWIQSKMTKIADYIGAVKHYLEYDEVMDVPGNRSEKKWSDADHDKQEKIAKEIEKENPGISKEKKMAFAGAQVNREKRKRSK